MRRSSLTQAARSATAAVLAGQRGARPAAARLGGFAAVCVLVAATFVNGGAATREAQFAPVSASVVSPRVFWALGSSCGSGHCWVVARTTDGGRRFTRTAAPWFPRQGDAPQVYAWSARDALLVVPWRPRAFVTHDAGTTWRHLRLGNVLHVATTGRVVYALTLGHGRYSLRRSQAGRGAWRTVAVPFRPDSPIVWVAARGRNIWLLGTRPGRRIHDTLASSSDGGQTFALRGGPCIVDLGGGVFAGSARVLWAVCPGGMMSEALRSDDGGATFRRLPTPPLTNGATLAPVSADAAVLVPHGEPFRFVRTTDAGRRWARVAAPRGLTDVSSVAFADRVGVAIALGRGGLPAGLLRSRDGGAHWTRLRIG